MRTVLIKMVYAVAAVFIHCAALPAQTPEIAVLRELYYQASRQQKAATEFYDKLKSVDGTRPVWLGYKGMAGFMLAYHDKNPLSKLRHFIEGRNILEKAIQSAPENPELRYLRFTVQTNAPEFLNYRRNIIEDRKLLLRLLHNPNQAEMDEDLRRRIIEYLLDSKYCPAREKETLATMDMILEDEQ